MKHKKILYIFLINIIFIELSFSYIIYPFKTRKIQIENENNNLTLLLRSIIDNHIFINLEMAEPKQIIEVFLRTDFEEFYFSEKIKCDINTNSPNPLIYDVNSSIINFYNINKSFSIEITNKSISNYKAGRHEGNFSSDYLYFKSNKDEIKKRISFILYNTTVWNMPGIIGLQFPKFLDNKNYYFIEQLKYNDIINSYFWMINYTSNYEGNLIIGEQPNIIYHNYYKDYELKIAHTFLYSNREWGLRFNKFLFDDKIMENDYNCLFSYENNYIMGNEKLEKELDIYFNEYITNNICFKEYIIYPYIPRIFFYCNKDKYYEKMKYFPNLEFYHNELNYTFELNYKDLFIEKYDKLILMIFFDEIKMSFSLGKPFLRKYSFLFNQDTKLIGYYIKKEKNKSDNNNNGVILKLIVIILLLIILFILGIIIGKYLIKKKKKPLNIIDEDYNYEYINKNNYQL